MHTRRFTAIFLVALSSQILKAQDTGTHPLPALPEQIRFCDLDLDDKLSKHEIRTVINQYFNNSARNVPSDLTTDVESVIIDLISYHEKINCTAIKNTAGSKRFIELYFLDRFAS